MAIPIETSCSDDLTAAYRRLNAAYQQALRYAEDVRVLYQQLQRGIYQSLLGLANALEAQAGGALDKDIVATFLGLARRD